MSSQSQSHTSDFVVPDGYGREYRRLFHTAPDVTNLNHGSFGTIPEPVLRSCEALTRECESNPDAFIRMQLFDRYKAARTALSQLVGADSSDTCVFINNVSTAMVTVLRSFKWSPTDHIICTDAVFASITLAINSVDPAPNVSKFSVGHHKSHDSILVSFREYIKEIKALSREQCGKEPSKQVAGTPKIVLVTESITANPALLLPWKQMVRICHEEDVWSIVDAAHSLGQESDINLQEVDPDFWMTNCSKGYYAMRGCAMLYVPLRNQEHVVPLVPGVRYPLRGHTPTKFVHSFFWSGMADPVAALSIEYAIAFRKKIGGDAKINSYCHSLAVDGGHLASKILGTSVMDTTESGELTASMTNIELPLAPAVKESPDVYFLFEDELIKRHKIFASPFYYQDRWWVRATAQIYNQLSDFELLASALLETCKKINEMVISKEVAHNAT